MYRVFYLRIYLIILHKMKTLYHYFESLSTQYS